MDGYTNTDQYDNAPVVVDLASALTYKNSETDVDFKSWTFCERPITGPHRIWKDYTDIDIAKTKELTEHQYFLLARIIPGFVLKDKSWRK